MFSFVLYDKRNNNIFAARDHIGIKPFFYTVQDDILYFSSEIKSLLPFIDKISEDYDGLAEYFTFQYSDLFTDSLFSLYFMAVSYFFIH